MHHSITPASAVNNLTTDFRPTGTIAITYLISLFKAMPLVVHTCPGISL